MKLLQFPILQNKTARDLTLIVLLLTVLPLVTTDYFSTLLGKTIILTIFAISLDLAWGYGGILSMGHSVFFGLGAYAFTLTAMHINGGTGLLLGIGLGILIPVVVAAIVSWFVFFSKASPFYIGVVTFSMSVLAEKLVIRFSGFTGGQNGISGVPSYPFSGLTLVYVLLLIFVVILYAVYRFVHSEFGKVMTAVKDNEERTRFLGYATPIVRTIIFILSGALAGLSGVMYAPFDGFISPSLLALTFATQVIVWVAIGGRGKVVGAVIGSLFINMLSPYFNEYFPNVWQIILGLMFVIAVIFFPKGIYSYLGKSNRDKKVVYQIEIIQKLQQRKKGEEVLTTHSLQVSYGSLAILKGVDLKLFSGELQCVIGPNGAGKSTLINAMTGRSVPTAGEVMLDGNRIEKNKPEKIVHLGVARTFQTTTVIGPLTVGENLQLAAGKGKFPSFFTRSNRIALTSSAEKLLRLSCLDQKLDIQASDLSHGDQQLLELCMAIALDPKVLLLDEPTAGLTAIERKQIGNLLVHLSHEEQLSLLIIEHDVDFVKKISDRVTVLYEGKIAADGTVQEVTQSELVKNVYLGGH